MKKVHVWLKMTYFDEKLQKIDNFIEYWSQKVPKLSDPIPVAFPGGFLKDLFWDLKTWGTWAPQGIYREYTGI